MRSSWVSRPLDVSAIYGVYAFVVPATLAMFGRVSDHLGRRPVLLMAVAAAALGEVVLLTERWGQFAPRNGPSVRRVPADETRPVSSALLVTFYLGASLPTVAAALMATEANLTAAVLALAGVVLALTLAAAVMNRLSTRAHVLVPAGRSGE